MFEKMGIKFMALLFAFMLVMGFGMNLHAADGFEPEGPADEEYYGGAEGHEAPEGYEQYEPEEYEEYEPGDYEEYEPEGFEEYEPEEYGEPDF